VSVPTTVHLGDPVKVALSSNERYLAILDYDSCGAASAIYHINLETNLIHYTVGQSSCCEGNGEQYGLRVRRGVVYDSDCLQGPVDICFGHIGDGPSRPARDTGRRENEKSTTLYHCHDHSQASVLSEVS